MEDRLRTASSQEKTDVLVWMGRGVRSVRFPAKGKQRPTSVKTPISFLPLKMDAGLFALQPWKNVFIQKENQETDVLLIWSWTGGDRGLLCFICLSLTPCESRETPAASDRRVLPVTDCKSLADCNEMPMKRALFCF